MSNNQDERNIEEREETQDEKEASDVLCTLMDITDLADKLRFNLEDIHSSKEYKKIDKADMDTYFVLKNLVKSATKLGWISEKLFKNTINNIESNLKKGN